MAASKVNKPVTDEIDEQILTCIVCLERYQNAKILPCHHSFCKECLEELVRKQRALNCPICRRPCPIPAGGVAKLPPSILVNGIIEIITAQTQDDQGSECDLCQEGVPINRCIDCSFYVCRNCTNTHVKIPATRHHRIMTLDEYERAKGDNAALAQPSVACKDHPENKLDFFCDTCEKPICMACAVVKHHGHEHREIKEAAESIRRSLEEKLEKLRVKTAEVTENLVQFKTKTQELDETYQREVNTVKKHTFDTEQKIRRKIREQEGELLQDLKARYEENKVRMETEGTTLTQMKEGSETSRVFVQSLIRYGNDVQLVSTAAETSANLDEVLTTAVPSIQDMYTLPNFSKRLVKVSGILGNLNLHDSVRAIIPGDIKSKDSVKITIHSHCCITSQSLKAEIVKPGSTTGELVPIEHPGTNRAGNIIGILSVYFGKVGSFQLSVTLKGQHILGSPYQITVNPQWSVHRVLKTTESDAHFQRIAGVRVDFEGNVLVTDMGNCRICVFDKELNFKKYLKFFFPGKKQFCPVHIAVSSENIYYVSDGGLYDYSTGKCKYGGNNQIVMTNIDGHLLGTFGQGKFGDPCGVSFGPDQKVLFVVDGLHHCIYAVDLTSKLRQMTKIGKRGRGPGEFQNPECIVISTSGNMIVSDTGNERVQLLDAFGVYLCQFGKQGDTIAGKLSHPLDIAIDRADNIYVCDRVTGSVMIYNKEGNFYDEIPGAVNLFTICFVDSMQHQMIVGEKRRLVIYKKLI